MFGKLLEHFKKEDWKKFCEIGANNFFSETFCVRLDNPNKKEYLKIGSENVIYGKFIFEHTSGHITVGNRCHIGACNIISVNSIDIGNDVIIAWDVTIYDHNSHSIYWDDRKNDVSNELKALKNGKNITESKTWGVVKSAPIIIKVKVWIGFGSSIMKGVTIGEGSVIAANSVVIKDVPPHSVVGGNPAVVIKKI